jgi:hypothetical protein
MYEISEADYTSIFAVTTLWGSLDKAYNTTKLTLCDFNETYVFQKIATV